MNHKWANKMFIYVIQ